MNGTLPRSPTAKADTEATELSDLTGWRNKAFNRARLTPAHLLIHDVELGAAHSWTADSNLGITDVSAAQIILGKEREARERERGGDGDEGPVSRDGVRNSGTRSAVEGAEASHERGREGATPPEELGTLPRDGLGSLRNEARQLQACKELYGWLSHLRLPDDAADPRKVRWIHVSSKFTEDLQGVFMGLTNWRVDEKASLETFRQINMTVRANERFSHHGKFFSPFVQKLHPFSTSLEDEHEAEITEHQPVLACFPFLDFTLFPGPTPPNRFQIDEREKSKRTSHPFCSLLQHFYHLEDTQDRDRSQVYTRHRPWSNDRELDLRVRRFYRHYPTGLGVDELWLLIIDNKHIVTFSSNQSWKTRFPQLQLADRVADISFYTLRPTFEDFDQEKSFNSLMQAILCIHGAVSLTHRGFWSALPLPCIDRYAGQFGHLKFRLYRAASTKLVLDLLQLQDELNIITHILQSQLKIIRQLDFIARPKDEIPTSPQKRFSLSHRAGSPTSSLDRDMPAIAPVADIIDNLERELVDLSELRNNTSELVNRTVQLVNLRLEDHGQAILVFTFVTVIFLPLSFLSSFLGMNVRDIRDMQNTQWVFWASAVALTGLVVGASCVLAFYGSQLMESFVTWKESKWRVSTPQQGLRDRLRRKKAEPPSLPTRPQQSFNVFGVETTFGPSWNS